MPWTDEQRHCDDEVGNLSRCKTYISRGADQCRHIRPLDYSCARRDLPLTRNIRDRCPVARQRSVNASRKQYFLRLQKLFQIGCLLRRPVQVAIWRLAGRIQRLATIT